MPNKSSKLKDADLVSYIPASKLGSAAYSNFAELQFGTGPWQKYWAVLHLQCLYIYQAKSSQLTVKTIVLPGYKISVAGPLVKKPFVITLTHSCVLPTNLAASDQAEMDAWFTALDQASRLITQATEMSSRGSNETLADVNKDKEGGASLQERESASVLSREKSTQESQVLPNEVVWAYLHSFKCLHLEEWAVSELGFVVVKYLCTCK